MPEVPFSDEPNGVRIAIRVTPRARKNEIAGVVAGADGRSAISIRLAAPPVDGAANEALIAYLAEALALPKSSIRIQSGETQRVKILHLAGNGEAVRDRLLRLLPT